MILDAKELGLAILQAWPDHYAGETIEDMPDTLKELSRMVEDNLLVFLIQELDEGGRGENGELSIVQVESVLERALSDVYAFKEAVLNHMKKEADKCQRTSS